MHSADSFRKLCVSTYWLLCKMNSPKWEGEIYGDHHQCCLNVVTSEQLQQRLGHLQDQNMCNSRYQPDSLAQLSLWRGRIQSPSTTTSSSMPCPWHHACKTNIYQQTEVSGDTPALSTPDAIVGSPCYWHLSIRHSHHVLEHVQSIIQSSGFPYTGEPLYGMTDCSGTGYIHTNVPVKEMCAIVYPKWYWGVMISSPTAHCTHQSLMLPQYWYGGLSCAIPHRNSCETPPFQFCDHVSDCSVQCH